MNTGINAYEANVSNRVGSNQYAFRVLVELEKLLVHDDVTVFLPSDPLPDLPKERKGWKYRVLRPSLFWSIWRLPLALYMHVLRGKTFHVFYSLGHYGPWYCPVPSVVTVMDVAFLQFPDFFKKNDVIKLTQWTAHSVQKAKKVIAISLHTKKDVCAVYGKKDNDVILAYPGFEHEERGLSVSEVVHKHHVRQPYLVYIGTLQPRKNLVRVVKAFERVAQSDHDLSLILAGKVGWMADDVVHAVQQSPMKKRIHLLGFISDREKSALYRGAKAAVLAGLYEGFGIPPLEAMAEHTIPIVSETASLPEVVGDAGVLVDPYSVDDIARGMSEALHYTKQQREFMLEKGKKQTEKFSWEETGKIIAEVLHDVGGKV